MDEKRMRHTAEEIDNGIDKIEKYPIHKTTTLEPSNWQLFEGAYRVQVTDAQVTDDSIVTAWPADDASSDIAQAAKVRENILVSAGSFYIRAQAQPISNMSINYTIQI